MPVRIIPILSQESSPISIGDGPFECSRCAQSGRTEWCHAWPKPLVAFGDSVRVCCLICGHQWLVRVQGSNNKAAEIDAQKQKEPR